MGRGAHLFLPKHDRRTLSQFSTHLGKAKHREKSSGGKGPIVSFWAYGDPAVPEVMWIGFCWCATAAILSACSILDALD